MKDSLTLGERCTSLVLLAAIGAGAFLAMDHLSRPVAEPSARSADVANRGHVTTDGKSPAYHAGRRRTFIFLIDSLRYETAVDPKLMPFLCEQQKVGGTYAKVRTAHDAVTVPALRAAFTGKDQLTVFGFLRNFLHGEEQIPSLFTQASAAGLKTAVWSEGSFKQFGDAIQDRYTNDPDPGGPEHEEMARQNAIVLEALKDYRDGGHDIVIAHVLYCDHASHRARLDSEEYARHFRRADRMVRQLAGAIPPDETFIVMGDHGHDEMGRHMVGLAVPTYAWFRGPGYRKGCDLGEIAIQDLRYLIGWGLQVPLASDYTAGRYPRALVAAGGEIRGGYERASPDGGEVAETGVSRQRYGQFYWLLLHLGLVASVWFRSLRRGSPAGGAGATRVLSLASVVPLAAPFWGPWNSVAGAGLALAALAAPWRVQRPSLREAAIALCPVLAAVALTHWGVLLMHVRVYIHEPRFATIMVTWLTVLPVGLGAIRLLGLGPMRTAWIVLALPGLLLYPTVYRYGASGIMAPAWICWAIYMVVGTRTSPPDLGSKWRNEWPAMVGVCMLIYLLLPFLLIEGNNFMFREWYNPLWDAPHISWLAHVWDSGFLVSIASLAIIFFPRRVTWKTLSLAGAIVAALTTVQWDLPAARWAGLSMRNGGEAMTILAGGVLAVALALSLWGRRVAGVKAFVRPVCVAGLWLAILALIRTGEAPPMQWITVFFAAIRLSAWLAQRFARGRWAQSSYPFLLLLGVLVAGWGTLAWTFHRLEWHFLYEWFAARAVEDKVAMFAPAIVLRYVLPMLVVRTLLAEFFEPAVAYPRRRITMYAGVKVLSLVFIALGLAFTHAGSDVYFEAVQESTIWLVMMLALC